MHVNPIITVFTTHSGAKKGQECRGPYDALNLGLLLGLRFVLPSSRLVARVISDLV